MDIQINFDDSVNVNAGSVNVNAESTVNKKIEEKIPSLPMYSFWNSKMTLQIDHWYWISIFISCSIIFALGIGWLFNFLPKQPSIILFLFWLASLIVSLF